MTDFLRILPYVLLFSAPPIILVLSFAFQLHSLRKRVEGSERLAAEMRAAVGYGRKKP